VTRPHANVLKLWLQWSV